MKSNKTYLLAGLALLIAACKSHTGIEAHEWEVTYQNGVNIKYRDMPVMEKIISEYSLQGRIVSTSDYGNPEIQIRKFSDDFGAGRKMTMIYTKSGLPTLRQTFRLYQDYVLTDMELVSDDTLRVNYMAPVVVNHTNNLVCDSTKRSLFVPYDNDAWIRFSSVHNTGDTLRSYEVTSIYNADTRHGLVLGAINHDKWKNAIDLLDHSSKLKIYSGVADRLTRDSRAHGLVSSTTITSSQMMIGYFDDWRKGMETYADANAIVAQPRPWGKAVPVGWNSWGALAFKVNHQNSTETAIFIADSLQSQSFHNSEGLVYTGLDSGWNSFEEKDLKDFADQCKVRNQVPCIYWTPFTDWGKNPNRRVGNTSYHYRDIYLYANGKPQELDGAYAIDPTHPAIRAMMEETASIFRRCGYKYVKMDFMTHGRMEADYWYKPGIETGTEAYNYGMQLLDSIFSDFYLNLSISPIFPAQYAQSRRIACDAWNKIKDTEYTMNALSWGWWIDRVYDFNDADHVVLRDATEGENRARVTSSVITGLFITGDDFSKDGDADAKRRALSMLTNPDINTIANGRSFRPLNGDDDRSENIFIRHEENGDIYLAVFNYGENPLTMALPTDRMELDPRASYDITELWSHQKLQAQQQFRLPGKDTMVFLLKVRK